MKIHYKKTIQIQILELRESLKKEPWKELDYVELTAKESRELRGWINTCCSTAAPAPHKELTIDGEGFADIYNVRVKLTDEPHYRQFFGIDLAAGESETIVPRGTSQSAQSSYCVDCGMVNDSHTSDCPHHNHFDLKAGSLLQQQP